MSNTANDIINLSLTKDEWNLIVESLLFSSSVDICSEWEPEHIYKSIDVAKSIKKELGKKLKLENIYIFESLPYADVVTDDIAKDFGDKIRRETSKYV